SCRVVAAGSEPECGGAETDEKPEESSAKCAPFARPRRENNPQQAGQQSCVENSATTVQRRMQLRRRPRGGDVQRNLRLIRGDGWANRACRFRRRVGTGVGEGGGEAAC